VWDGVWVSLADLGMRIADCGMKSVDFGWSVLGVVVGLDD